MPALIAKMFCAVVHSTPHLYSSCTVIIFLKHIDIFVEMEAGCLKAAIIKTLGKTRLLNLAIIQL